MEGEVLVLNSDYEPLNVCNMRRAIMLVHLGKAEVLHCSHRIVRYNAGMWQSPSVLKLRQHVRRPLPQLRLSRRSVFARDDYQCQYCGQTFERKDLNLDHVIPRDRGGPTTWENIVCSCIECNTHKANRTPQEAGMHLVRKPKRPKWRPFVQINLSLHQHDSWKHFVDLAYWNVELGEDVA